MSKIFREGNTSITRDLKIDESAKNNYQISEIPLKSVTQKFLKEPLTLETFDKKFRQMYDNNSKKEPESDEPVTKKPKRQEGKAIFYDIFVKPKENKIKEILDKRSQKNKSTVTTTTVKNKTYISNKINSEGKILGMNGQAPQIQYDFKSFTTNIIKEEEEPPQSEESKGNEKTKKKPKKDISKKTIKKNEELQKNLNVTLGLKEEIDTTLLNNFLHDKYILNKNSNDATKKNYFNQLIQIRPPEGINAVVASPLMDSKGWAPSIPSVNIDKLNTNLKDLMIRAKGGIKNNDIIKEAHMAFYLGIMNEEEKKYESALKFYKKYFLSAKLLQDIYGTELALNRIAVLFSNIFDFEQSIYYNEKHKEITTHNLNGFVAFYNCGVCYRVLENFSESIKNFERALKMSEEENDLESYTLCLAQLAISYIFTGNIEAYMDHSEQFFENNKTLKHIEMELEMQILSGYIYNYIRNLDTSESFYKNALANSVTCENERYKAVSLCNIGIIEADKDIDIFLTNLGDPTKSQNMKLDYDEEEEEQNEEPNEQQNGEQYKANMEGYQNGNEENNMQNINQGGQAEYGDMEGEDGQEYEEGNEQEYQGEGEEMQGEYEGGEEGEEKEDQGQGTENYEEQGQEQEQEQ